MLDLPRTYGGVQLSVRYGTFSRCPAHDNFDNNSKDLELLDLSAEFFLSWKRKMKKLDLINMQNRTDRCRPQRFTKESGRWRPIIEKRRTYDVMDERTTNQILGSSRSPCPASSSQLHVEFQLSHCAEPSRFTYRWVKERAMVHTFQHNKLLGDINKTTEILGPVDVM